MLHFAVELSVPQTTDLNQKAWRELEHTIAEYYANAYQEVWVITGPIYDKTVEYLKNNVETTEIEIPDTFYKIVLDVERKNPRILAWIIPQDVVWDKDDLDKSLDQFLVSVDEVETQTGLNFLSWLDDSIEDSLEAETPTTLW